MKRFLVLMFAGIMMAPHFSCEKWTNDEVPATASLNITVRGLFSGKRRENIKVRIYEFEEDANNRNDPIQPYKITDENGEVTFYNLPPFESYWVSVDAKLSSNVEQTQILDDKENTFEIRLL